MREGVLGCGEMAAAEVAVRCSRICSLQVQGQSVAARGRGQGQQCPGGGSRDPAACCPHRLLAPLPCQPLGQGIAGGWGMFRGCFCFLWGQGCRGSLACRGAVGTVLTRPRGDKVGMPVSAGEATPGNAAPTTFLVPGPGLCDLLLDGAGGKIPMRSRGISAGKERNRIPPRRAAVPAGEGDWQPGVRSIPGYHPPLLRGG